jgi:hypothetical protein
MQLIAPDILADARGLSPVLCILGLIAGAALWLLGWWSHRFWAVLITTVLGGIYGLYEGPTLRAQPLVAAVLLAIAAGVLALQLVRLVAFAGGGLALLAALQSLGPSGEQALIFFLAGGLMGLILFRLWVMVLTSVGGVVLMGYCGLWLADSLHKLNAPEWAVRNDGLLNGACGGAALVGLLVQLYFNRKKVEAKPKAKSGGKGKKPPPEPESPPEKKSLPWGLGGLFRKAG